MQVFRANSGFFGIIFATTAETLDPSMQLRPILAEKTSRSQLMSLLVGRIPGGKPGLPGKQKEGPKRTFGLEMEWRYSISEIILTPENSKKRLPPKLQRWQAANAYMD